MESKELQQLPWHAASKGELRLIVDALQTAGGLTTKQLTLRVAQARGWDMTNRRMLQTAHQRVWQLLSRQRLCGRVASERSKGGDCVWRLLG